MKRNTGSPNWPLAELLRLLNSDKPHGLPASGLRPLGAGLLAAGTGLAAGGVLDGQSGLGLVLLGWLLISSSPPRPAKPAVRVISIWRPVLRHLTDTTLLFGAGIVCLYRWGYPQHILGLAAAAALTCYLAYYSGAALLKSVPGEVRLACPASMVELDHLFLVRGTLWGAERALLFVPAAMGLLAGKPAWGLAAAIVLGNFYWIGRSWKFWSEKRAA